MSVPAFSPSPDGDQVSDADLIAAVRAGRTTAFGVLWERHAGAARRYAAHCTSTHSDAEDLVSDAFTKVLQNLRSGGGPESAFRTYLLRTVRTLAIDRGKRGKRTVLTDEMEDFSAEDDPRDPVVAELDKSLAARAFRQLPANWQTVLWHTAIERERPVQVAAVMGMSPHNVAALAYRAREGLRQAYLNEYARDTKGGVCAEIAASLGTFERGSLKSRQDATVRRHLSECARCRQVKSEVSHLSATMRVVLGPLLVGGAVAAYLAKGGSRGPAGAAASWNQILRARTARLVAVGAVAAAVIAMLITIDGSSRSQAQPPAAQPRAPISRRASAPATRSSEPAPTPGLRPAPVPNARRRALPIPLPRQRTHRAGPPTQPVSDQAPGNTSARTDSPTAAKPTSSAPRVTRSSTTTPAPSPFVTTTIGTQHHAYDATTVPLVSTNHTASAGELVLTLTLPAHIQLASSGSCSNTGSATSPVLNCGSISKGSTATESIVLGAVPNGNGTFSPWSGTMTVQARINTGDGSRSAAVEIRCGPPYD